MTIRVGQLVTGIVSLVLLGAGWFFLAPTQLGGSVSYVQTYGTSMEPHFHAGDLAIVRAASDYRVGDVVAYRNASLGNHVVLHRIVRIVDGRYFFKGDNNSFVDSYQPEKSGLVGKLWLHVPAVGHYLVWLHGSHLFLAAGAVVLLILLLGGGKRLPKRRPSLSFGALPLGAAGLLVLCAGLAALAYSRPLTTHALQSDLYTQTGRFSYDAAAPGGARVYGSTTVRTGQPLFLRLVHDTSFHFGYSFGSSAPHGVAGTIALAAEVVGSDGWKRTLALTAPQRFSGDHATITGTLDLRSLSTLLEKVDALSNVNGGTYTLTLLPKVHVQGIASGNAVKDDFAPKLALMLDPNQLQLQPGSVTGAGAGEELTRTASGSGTVATANRISLAKLRLSVPAARRVSLYGGAVALLLLLVGLALGPRSRSAERLYEDLIVEVDAVPAEAGTKIVRTSSLEGLARIAEQGGRLIMAAEHTFFVEDGGVRYVFEHEAKPVAEPRKLRLARGA